MMTGKKTLTTVMATVFLIQSLMPVSIFAIESPLASRTSFDTRLATIKISDNYKELKDSGKLGTWDAVLLAARLYAVIMVGPSCEQQQVTANATRLLDGNKATTSPYQQFLPNLVDNKATSPVDNRAGVALINVAPICAEVFSEGLSDPSADLLKIYEKFFAVFFPEVDFNTFSQAVSEGTDPATYLDGIARPESIQKVYTYLDTKQIPTQTCALSPVDEALYMKAKAEYIDATQKNQAAVAKLAFDTMNQIQSRVVCAPGAVQGATPTPTLNPDCVNKVSILNSQISSLNKDLHQQDIARIQKSIDTITQSSDCSLDTRRAQLPIESGLGVTPRLTTDVLKFQAVSPTVTPDTTPLFCQSTASTLETQLANASYFTVSKLIETIDDIKGELNPQKQSLATLIQSLAVNQAAIKAQSLGLTNPSNAMRRFVNILEMIASNILTNPTMYKFVDFFPLMDGYSDAIDQTSLGKADTFAGIQSILDAGARFVWDANNKSFVQEKTSNPGVTFVGRSSDKASSNDLSVVIKQLAAFQFTEWTQEMPYSPVVTPSAPTLQDLTILYFGSQNGETTPYQETRNNRVWYEVTPSAGTKISDQNYAALVSNKRYYNYLAAGSLAIEIVDVNGGHIAIVGDQNQRVVRYLDPGTYQNAWMNIQVGNNGSAVILYKNTTTLPKAIDLAGSINGNLQVAVKGDIKWPDKLSSFIQQTPEEKFEADRVVVGADGERNISRDGFSVYAENSMRSITESNKISISKPREDMVPERVTGELFFSPHVLKFELNRAYNATNGTNTITLQATLVGGSTCGVQINASVTYLSNEFGIVEEEGEGNPVLSAQFEIGTDSYKFALSSSHIDDIVEAAQASEDEEVDLVSLVNQKITNNLSVLGTSFGTLVATQDGINIRYPDGQEEDLVPILSTVAENMDLGRLGQFIDFASDGGGKDTPTPNTVPYVDSYSSDQNVFMLTFADGGSLINPKSSPVLYVESCFEGCQTYAYKMQLSSDRDYTYTVPSEVYEQATAIYMQAEHNGYPINHTFM